MKTKLTPILIAHYLLIAIAVWIKYRRFPKLSEFSEGGE